MSFSTKKDRTVRVKKRSIEIANEFNRIREFNNLKLNSSFYKLFFIIQSKRKRQRKNKLKK